MVSGKVGGWGGGEVRTKSSNLGMSKTASVELESKVEIFETRACAFEGDWKRVVLEWAKLNDQYLHECADFPAWYIENSNTALLSAAAWRCGFTSLCEPGIDKQEFKGRPGRPREYAGRVDMEIYIEDQWVLLEAKKEHFRLTNSPHHRASRRERLANLYDRSLKGAKGSRRAASGAGCHVKGLGFFSAGIGSDSVERRDDNRLREGLGKEEAVKKAIADEVDRLCEGISHLNACYAIFTSKAVRLQNWAGAEFPAAFGLIMSEFPPKRPPSI